MRNEATLEQWAQLYEVAIKLKDLKPWENLRDMDLITIVKGVDVEPTVCSIMGQLGECYAIAAYDGYSAINNFFTVVGSNNVPMNQMIRYHENLMCNFGSREELTKEELKLIKDLGLKFRGKNNWIYFRAIEPGYIPYMLDEEEVLNLTEILRHLYMALKAMERGVVVDFEGGNTLARTYDEESELWLNYEIPIHEILSIGNEINYDIPVLGDELLVKRLKNLKNSNTSLELDIAFLNSTVKDKNFDKPFLTRLAMIVDRKRGTVLAHYMMTPQNEVIVKENLLGTIIDYSLQVGKPKEIWVRDKMMAAMISGLCEQIGINMKVSGYLKGIDTVVESFDRFRIQKVSH
ncbi:MAG: hypothetical protein RR128_06605 [Clostridium sp.]